MQVLPHVVIVGGGFAGLNAARGLAGAKVRVTLVDRSNYHLFQPLLYQVATAGLSPADIASPIRSLLRQRNAEVAMAEVVGVQPSENLLLLDDGTLAYDFLVLATGATHSYFGHPEWKALAPGLKTIQDATCILAKILSAFEAAERMSSCQEQTELLTFVIVGGGPTGVEIAGSVAELAHRTLICDFRRISPKATRVLLIEAGQRILPAFDESLSHRAKAYLKALKVEVLEGVTVDQVHEWGGCHDTRRNPGKNSHMGCRRAGIACGAMAASHC